MSGSLEARFVSARVIAESNSIQNEKMKGILLQLVEAMEEQNLLLIEYARVGGSTIDTAESVAEMLDASIVFLGYVFDEEEESYVYHKELDQGLGEAIDGD